MKTELTKHIKSFIGDSVYYDPYGGGYIWGKPTNEMVAEIPEIEEGNAVVSIRGWGAIQNLKNLPCSPEEFQDAIGEFITDAINEKLNRILN